MARPKGCSKGYLDKLASKRCKEAVDYKCEICGSLANEAHHIEGRRNHSVRWFLPNLICLCDKCHRNGPRAAHKNIVGFLEDVRKIRNVDELSRRAGMVFKWQKHLPEIKAYLKGEREDYLGDE